MDKCSIVSVGRDVGTGRGLHDSSPFSCNSHHCMNFVCIHVPPTEKGMASGVKPCFTNLTSRSCGLGPINVVRGIRWLPLLIYVVTPSGGKKALGLEQM